MFYVVIVHTVSNEDKEIYYSIFNIIFNDKRNTFLSQFLDVEHFVSRTSSQQAMDHNLAFK